MFCPNCKAEYRPGFTRCSDCDVDLVDFLPKEIKINNNKNENEIPDEIPAGLNTDELALVPVLSIYNLGDIAVVKDILEGQGIDYYMQGENTHYIRSYTGPTILMVREDQVQTVRDLLSKFDLKFTIDNSVINFKLR